MSNTQLTVKIVGSPDDHGYVHLDDFARFVDTVVKCLRRAESIVAGDSDRASYRITALRCKSATLTLEPVRKTSKTQNGAAAVRFFRDAVVGIQKGQVDPRMGPDDLQVFRELTAPLGKNVHRIMIGRHRLTESYSNAIDKLLRSEVISQGTVTGFLERLNVHGKNEFVLYPESTGPTVTCSFHESHLDDVREAIKKNVTVSGTLYYRKSGAFPARVHVTAIEIHPEDNELPTLFDVRDLGNWGTGQLDSLDFIRSIRDEQEA